jgi:hypothetical protein
MIKWLISLVLLFLAAFLMCVNAASVIRWRHSKTKSSMIPFIGGMLGAVGLRIIPVIGVSKWWWISFFLDFGSIPILAALVWHKYLKREEKLNC